MAESTFHSFAEFWPYYLNEHSKPGTRWLHLIGTASGLALAVFVIVIGKWWLFPLALIPGYGAAWIGHLFIEKNKPATFQHPLWSFLGDYKMIGLMLSGGMDAELRRLSTGR